MTQLTMNKALQANCIGLAGTYNISQLILNLKTRLNLEKDATHWILNVEKRFVTSQV